MVAGRGRCCTRLRRLNGGLLLLLLLLSVGGDEDLLQALHFERDEALVQLFVFLCREREPFSKLNKLSSLFGFIRNSCLLYYQYCAMQENTYAGNKFRPGPVSLCTFKHQSARKTDYSKCSVVCCYRYRRTRLDQPESGMVGLMST